MGQGLYGTTIIENYYNKLLDDINSCFTKTLMKSLEALSPQHSRMMTIVERIKFHNLERYKEIESEIIKEIETRLENLKSNNISTNPYEHFWANYELFKDVYCFKLKIDKSVYPDIVHDFLLVVSPFYLSPTCIQELEYYFLQFNKIKKQILIVFAL